MRSSGTLSFINIVARKKWIAIVEEKGTKIIHRHITAVPAIEVGDVLF